MTFACLALVAVGPLRAGTTIRFPEDGSSITLTLPDGWTTSDGGDGSLKCTSADGDIFFDLLPGRVVPDPRGDLLLAAQGMAEATGLTDIKSTDSGEKANPNGVKIEGILIIGRKGDVPYAGVVSVVTPLTGDRCAFQCFGPKTSLLIHSKEMAAITASFKSAK